MVKLPYVKCVYHDREDYHSFLNVLTLFQHQPVTITVLDHEDSGETVVVFQRPDDDQLTAVLRGWVQGWWDDDDDTTEYGDMDGYLEGFVIREREEVQHGSGDIGNCSATGRRTD